MKKPLLQFDQQLSSIPIRNERVTTTAGDDGQTLIVEVKLQYPPLVRLLGKLLKMQDRKRFQLDAVGREVYESIDGRKSFEELIDAFAERHKLTFYESRALLMQYMEMLMKRGLVVVGIRN